MIMPGMSGIELAEQTMDRQSVEIQGFGQVPGNEHNADTRQRHGRSGSPMSSGPAATWSPPSARCDHLRIPGETAETMIAELAQRIESDYLAVLQLDQDGRLVELLGTSSGVGSRARARRTSQTARLLF
jgi:hypothetical protein